VFVSPSASISLATRLIFAKFHVHVSGCVLLWLRCYTSCKGKGIPYSITKRRVPGLIPVLGSQPAGDVSHNPGGRLPLLSARPAVIPPQPVRGLLQIFLLGEQRQNGCEQFA